MSEHSVESHLKVDVAAYDVAIRTFVPYYEEMLQKGVELLRSLIAPKARIVDLGGGTGALTQAILRGMPDARVELLDIDPQMLQQARQRLANFGDRVSFRKGSFLEPLPACDAVVASLSLHHIPEIGDKTRVYQAILATLPPGGVFLNLDATVSADPRLAALTFDAWAASMAPHGIDDAAARRHFEDWKTEDRYYSVHEELTALANAGFKAPECFWRRGPTTIYGGLKTS